MNTRHSPIVNALRWLTLATLSVWVLRAQGGVGVFPPGGGGSGSGLPTGCTGASGSITCTGGFTAGDGTVTSGVKLPELTANGSSDFALYGRDSQSSSLCYFMPTTDTAAGEVWIDGGTTVATTEAVPRNCTVLVPASVATLQSCADTGSTDAYACNLPICPAAYETGGHYKFKAGTVNTGAATVNFCSLGAKTIKKLVGGTAIDLATGDIPDEAWISLLYDGTNMQIQTPLGNAPSGGSGVDMSTQGYCFIWNNCAPVGTDSSAALDGYTANTVYMIQIVIPYTIKFSALKYAGSGSGSMTFALYNSVANAPDSKVAGTEGTTSSLGTSITIASAATVSPGVYFFGLAVSDATQAYNRVHPPQNQPLTYLLGNTGINTPPRVVSCSNAASGSPYAMPATCGTATGVSTYNFSLPQFVIVP